MKKYISLSILSLVSVSTLFSQEWKADQTQSKQFSAVKEVKADCSNSEARKISDDLKQAVIY